MTGKRTATRASARDNRTDLPDGRVGETVDFARSLTATRDASENEWNRKYVEALFQKYRYSLLRFLVALSLSEQDAAEILQDTYLRLLKKRELDRIEGNARSYIFIVATNLVRDRHRRRAARRQDSHVSIEDVTLTSSAPTPDIAAEWSEIARLFGKSLLELDPTCRRIFLMHRFRHMPYPIIARALGISTRTVERNISAAMSYLRNELKDYL